MVQLADLAAYILRRRTSIQHESDARGEAAMQRLYDAVVAAIPEPSGRYLTVRA
jgi:hypothetical protein